MRVILSPASCSSESPGGEGGIVAFSCFAFHSRVYAISLVLCFMRFALLLYFLFFLFFFLCCIGLVFSVTITLLSWKVKSFSLALLFWPSSCIMLFWLFHRPCDLVLFYSVRGVTMSFPAALLAVFVVTALLVFSFVLGFLGSVLLLLSILCFHFFTLVGVSLVSCSKFLLHT